MYKKSILASVLPLILIGCGGGSSDSKPADPQTPPDPALLITSTPVTRATEDIAYQYQLTTNSDANITYSVDGLASGMGFDQLGLLTWTPVEGQLTSGEITITATDSQNQTSATQQFEIAVTPVNDAPVVSLIPDLSVESGNALSYQIQVTDPDDVNDGQGILFSVITAPNGLTVNDTGLINFSSAAIASAQHSVVLSVQDGLEDAVSPVEVSFSLAELYYYAFSGSLQNYNDSSIVIPQGDVQLANQGQVIGYAQSNEQGTYQLKVLDRDLELSQPLVFSADAVGYTSASQVMSFTEIAGDVDLFLPKVHATQKFNHDIATNLEVDGNTIIELEENSFVTVDGSAVSGEITAELFIIDPSLDIDLMPGEMITDNGQGSLVPIESFGAFTATFSDAQGNDLQLANGKQATIRIPVSQPDISNLAPTTIPLFYYDEVQGIWVEEGSATQENGYYVGQVSHFTTWNADRVFETVQISGCVQDENGALLANARIRTEGLDYNGRDSAYSDEQGQFTIAARQNSRVLISAVSNFQSRTLIVNTSASDTALNECLVLDEAITKIQLTWGESPRDLDSHFYGPTTSLNGTPSRFHVYYGNEQFTLNGDVIYLDVDDTSSFGPEVITVPSFSEPGVYRYGVHQYSSSGVMARYETQVELTIDGERYSFTPPTGTAQRWWHVFNIEVADDLSYQLVRVNQWETTNPDTAADVAQAASFSAISRKFDRNQSIARQLLEAKYYAK